MDLNTVLKVEFSIGELNIIRDALTELPWKKSNPVIANLDKQVLPQIKESNNGTVASANKKE